MHILYSRFTRSTLDNALPHPAGAVHERPGIDIRRP